MVIDVNGVGYEVEAPLGVFSDLPENGKQVAILIHHHFSQDAQTLYGFASLGERELFRKLLKISGIGAKMALNILSGASGEELARYVASGDVASLTRVPGIGKKTAERIIMELRDKLTGLNIGTGGGVRPGAAPVSTDPATEASHALASLGYKPAGGQPYDQRCGRGRYGRRDHHPQSAANQGKAEWLIQTTAL